MTRTHENMPISTTDTEPAGDVASASAHESGPSGDPGEETGCDKPRIVEEHHITSADGMDDIEAVDSRGRRWYHVRPEPRGRADVMGVSYSYWLIAVLLLVVVFLPWGWWY